MTTLLGLSHPLLEPHSSPPSVRQPAPRACGSATRSTNDAEVEPLARPVATSVDRYVQQLRLASIHAPGLAIQDRLLLMRRINQAAFRQFSAHPRAAHHLSVSFSMQLLCHGHELCGFNVRSLPRRGLRTCSVARPRFADAIGPQWKDSSCVVPLFRVRWSLGACQHRSALRGCWFDRRAHERPRLEAMAPRQHRIVAARAALDTGQHLPRKQWPFTRSPRSLRSLAADAATRARVSPLGAATPSLTPPARAFAEAPRATQRRAPLAPLGSLASSLAAPRELDGAAPPPHAPHVKRHLETLATGLPFLWAGLVLGLSFVETPLKFRAPGVTLELGLGIGRLVFHTLNRIELVVATVLFALLLRKRVSAPTGALLALLASILAAQTFWLLPALDERAAALISGSSPPPSSHHQLFVALESLKVLALLALPFTLHPTRSTRGS